MAELAAHGELLQDMFQRSAAVQVATDKALALVAEQSQQITDLKAWADSLQVVIDELRPLLESPLLAGWRARRAARVSANSGPPA